MLAGRLWPQPRPRPRPCAPSRARLAASSRAPVRAAAAYTLATTAALAVLREFLEKAGLPLEAADPKPPHLTDQTYGHGVKGAAEGSKLEL